MTSTTVPTAVSSGPHLSKNVASAIALDRTGAWRASLAASWRAFALSRVLVWVAGLAALFAWGLDAQGNALTFDRLGLTREGPAWLDDLVAPAARWDAVWFLSIARDGYDEARAAFFPLYPALVAATGATVVGAIVVSGVAAVAGLTVVHRLVALDFGEPAARLTVVLLAFCPTAFFLSAVYSESLYLALSAGALYAARTRQWLWAGAVGALAATTRSAGLVLLVPLLLMAWRARREDGRAPAAVLLVPLGPAAYCLALGLAGFDALAPFQAQEAYWMRELTVPFAGVVEGVQAALTGRRADVLLLGALLVVLATLALAVRRLPAPYWGYCVAALALPLSTPVPAQPLMSLPRFALVLFPLHLAAALWLLERRPAVRGAVLAVNGALLAVLAASFATWHWVA